MLAIGMKVSCPRSRLTAWRLSPGHNEREMPLLTSAARQDCSRCSQKTRSSPAAPFSTKCTRALSAFDRSGLNRTGPVRAANNGASYNAPHNSHHHSNPHSQHGKPYSGMPPDPLLRPASSLGNGPPENFNPSEPPFTLSMAHVFLFVAILIGGIIYLALTLQVTSPESIEFKDAMLRVGSRVLNSIAFRQLLVIASLILLVRFGLNWLVRYLGSWTKVNFDRTKTYYVIKEVYQPLELLLFIAGVCTIADAFVPQLISVPKNVVSHFVRATLAVSFIVCAASMAMRFKRQFCQENAWQAEMNGDITSQRRWEAYDKLGTFAVYVLAFIFVVQAVGLEVTSVLAIGGVGGLAIGLAGREIFENLFNGFLILTSNPFEVGDEVCFYPNGNKVEGLVMDIGWYRTLIRSFEREVYIIPNAVFSKNTVLNITRKGREWRFFEMISVRVQDVSKVNAIVSDMRRIIKNDSRILNSLHKRVYLDKITMEDIKIYISFYVEAATRDVFMTIKQDFLLGFIDCMHRNGAQLAQKKTLVELVGPGGSSPSAVLDAFRTGAQEEKNILLSSVEDLNLSQTQNQEFSGPFQPNISERKKRVEPLPGLESTVAPAAMAAGTGAALSSEAFKDQGQAVQDPGVLPAGSLNGNGVQNGGVPGQDSTAVPSTAIVPQQAPGSTALQPAAASQQGQQPAANAPGNTRGQYQRFSDDDDDEDEDDDIDVRIVDTSLVQQKNTKGRSGWFSFHNWASNLVESFAISLGFEPSRDVLPPSAQAQLRAQNQAQTTAALPAASDPTGTDSANTVKGGGVSAGVDGQGEAVKGSSTAPKTIQDDDSIEDDSEFVAPAGTVKMSKSDRILSAAAPPRLDTSPSIPALVNGNGSLKKIPVEPATSEPSAGLNPVQPATKIQPSSSSEAMTNAATGQDARPASINLTNSTNLTNDVSTPSDGSSTAGAPSIEVPISAEKYISPSPPSPTLTPAPDPRRSQEMPVQAASIPGSTVSGTVSGTAVHSTHLDPAPVNAASSIVPAGDLLSSSPSAPKTSKSASNSVDKQKLSQPADGSRPLVAAAKKASVDSEVVAQAEASAKGGVPVARVGDRVEKTISLSKNVSSSGSVAVGVDVLPVGPATAGEDCYTGGQPQISHGPVSLVSDQRSVQTVGEKTISSSGKEAVVFDSIASVGSVMGSFEEDVVFISPEVQRGRTQDVGVRQSDVPLEQIVVPTGVTPSLSAVRDVSNEGGTRISNVSRNGEQVSGGDGGVGVRDPAGVFVNAKDEYVVDESKGRVGVRSGGNITDLPFQVLAEPKIEDPPPMYLSTTADEFLSELDAVPSPEPEEEDFFSSPSNDALSQPPQQQTSSTKDRGIIEPAASAISALAAALPKLVGSKPVPPPPAPEEDNTPFKDVDPLPLHAAPKATSKASELDAAVESLPEAMAETHPAYSSMEMFEQVMLFSTMLHSLSSEGRDITFTSTSANIIQPTAQNQPMSPVTESSTTETSSHPTGSSAGQSPASALDSSAQSQFPSTQPASAPSVSVPLSQPGMPAAGQAAPPPSPTPSFNPATSSLPASFNPATAESYTPAPTPSASPSQSPTSQPYKPMQQSIEQGVPELPQGVPAPNVATGRVPVVASSTGGPATPSTPQADSAAAKEAPAAQAGPTSAMSPHVPAATTPPPSSSPVIPSSDVGSGASAAVGVGVAAAGSGQFSASPGQLSPSTSGAMTNSSFSVGSSAVDAGVSGSSSEAAVVGTAAGTAAGTAGGTTPAVDSVAELPPSPFQDVEPWPLNAPWPKDEPLPGIKVAPHAQSAASPASQPAQSASQAAQSATPSASQPAQSAMPQPSHSSSSSPDALDPTNLPDAPPTPVPLSPSASSSEPSPTHPPAHDAPATATNPSIPGQPEPAGTPPARPPGPLDGLLRTSQLLTVSQGSPMPTWPSPPPGIQTPTQASSPTQPVATQPIDASNPPSPSLQPGAAMGASTSGRDSSYTQGMPSIPLGPVELAGTGNSAPSGYRPSVQLPDVVPGTNLAASSPHLQENNWSVVGSTDWAAQRQGEQQTPNSAPTVRSAQPAAAVPGVNDTSSSGGNVSDRVSSGSSAGARDVATAAESQAAPKDLGIFGWLWPSKPSPLAAGAPSKPPSKPSSPLVALEVALLAQSLPGALLPLTGYTQGSGYTQSYEYPSTWYSQVAPTGQAPGPPTTPTAAAAGTALNIAAATSTQDSPSVNQTAGDAPELQQGSKVQDVLHPSTAQPNTDIPAVDVSVPVPASNAAAQPPSPNQPSPHHPSQHSTEPVSSTIPPNSSPQSLNYPSQHSSQPISTPIPSNMPPPQPPAPSPPTVESSNPTPTDMLTTSQLVTGVVVSPAVQPGVPQAAPTAVPTAVPRAPSSSVPVLDTSPTALSVSGSQASDLPSPGAKIPAELSSQLAAAELAASILKKVQATATTSQAYPASIPSDSTSSTPAAALPPGSTSGSTVASSTGSTSSTESGSMNVNIVAEIAAGISSTTAEGTSTNMTEGSSTTTGTSVNRSDAGVEFGSVDDPTRQSAISPAAPATNAAGSLGQLIGTAASDVVTSGRSLTGQERTGSTVMQAGESSRVSSTAEQAGGASSTVSSTVVPGGGSSGPSSTAGWVDGPSSTSSTVQQAGGPRRSEAAALRSPTSSAPAQPSGAVPGELEDRVTNVGSSTREVERESVTGGNSGAGSMPQTPLTAEMEGGSTQLFTSESGKDVGGALGESGSDSDSEAQSVVQEPAGPTVAARRQT